MIHPSEETLNHFVERELTPAEHVRVATHLETCTECARVVAEIQHIVREASTLGPVTPPPRVWTLLQERLSLESFESRQSLESLRSRESLESQKSLQSLQSRTESRTARAHSQWRSFAWAMATAALVVMAFLAGRFMNTREQPTAVVQRSAPQPHTATATDAAVRERVLLIAVGNHLERSQMVLVELAHADTDGALDISEERQLADDLVASNRLYRQTAHDIGQAHVASVLDELERVLVEVARGPSTMTIRQLEALQRRIETQGILFKVKVIESEIRTQPVS